MTSDLLIKFYRLCRPSCNRSSSASALCTSCVPKPGFFFPSTVGSSKRLPAAAPRGDDISRNSAYHRAVTTRKWWGKKNVPSRLSGGALMWHSGFFSGSRVKLLSLILCHSEACHISLKQTQEHFCLEWLGDPVSRAAHIHPTRWCCDLSADWVPWQN